MSLPPSIAGLLQEIVTALLLTLSISGLDGGPGGSVGKILVIVNKNCTLIFLLDLRMAL